MVGKTIVPKIEGVYTLDLERKGQELLSSEFSLPSEYREKLFHTIPEELDLEIFLSHIEFIRTNQLPGFSFINIKPSTLLNFYEDILNLIDRRIVLELREDWITSKELEKIKRIRENYMFLLALDDFGTGASNMDRVRALSPNFLKIDMKLFENVKELTNFVHFLRHYAPEAVLVAEKTETIFDFRMVRGAGIRLWSGWFEKEIARREKEDGEQSEGNRLRDAQGSKRSSS